MGFYPFEVTIPHVIYSCLGGFIVLFGMFSLFLRERLYIGEACWAFLFGVIIGPYGAGIFDPRSWGSEDSTNTVTLEFTRVVLAIGVFAIGVELPKAYMRRHWKSLFFLLAPVMTWGWFVSAGLIYALIPGLNFLSSLAIAACLTPTDPILAAAVVGGKYADKHVPAHIRHLLAAESGCNDGAAFPFLYIALYLVIDAPSTGKAIKDWFLLLWLYQVVLGVVIGSCLGFGFRHLMKFCERHDLIDRHSYVAQYVSLAMFATGVTTLLGSDDLLSAFACGTAFAWDGFFNRQTEESVFSSVIDLLFNIAAFVFVGAWMPFKDFSNEELTLSVWRLIVIAILVLLLRRLPVMIALYKWIPDIKTFREAVFSGHFGPIGIGAVFISTLAAEVLHNNLGDNPSHQNELLVDTIQPIVAFMVLCSITIHGLSIPSFSLGRRVHSVSRTWSRHASMPDWTNQARMVDRREDIVVNRDHVDEMERGEMSPEEKTDVESSPSSGSAPATLSQKEVGHEHEVERENDAVQNAEEKEKKEGSLHMPEGEEPPDGRETLSEWQEGPYRIIERRAGPGEEVEVEVIKNAGHEEGEESHIIRTTGHHDSVRHEVRALLERLAEGPPKVVHTIEHEVAKATRRLSPSPPRKDGEEEEEGWASEHSDAEGEASTSAMDRRKRSKSPRVKAPVKSGTKRRRASIRRGLAGHFMAQEGRGRESLASPQHLRVNSVKAMDSSREASPSRSIRFVDEEQQRHSGGSGASTPRMNEEADSTRNKVTFGDLPRPSSSGNAGV
ncbi:Sodium/hydrogen exchanger family-domain-containing protein [Desarmillaria tabescens]|uniref:Sodium/hydrogen exchanger family-domain-containing protein n=1 Tax=Armillaria tabescens TaxID=1929756 RepID=A0AA39N4Z0_ARMTA|nr:Sodium/hydrogen exchanger family-domain-containing protein [Desarmillaria tabescens]KAK0457460.1 Sodium/hydrogen exchanger family-domain-containing protein [Desarmillaria tabescens]